MADKRGLKELPYVCEGLTNGSQLVVRVLQTAFQAFPNLPRADHPRLDLRAVDRCKNIRREVRAHRSANICHRRVQGIET